MVNLNTLELVYDYESAINIWTYVGYDDTTNTIHVYYLADNETYVDEQAIVSAILNDNVDTYRNYFDTVPNVICQQETPQHFLEMFDDATAYRVGFNSDYYDLLLIAFIVSFIKTYNTLPTPVAIRALNDSIISPKRLYYDNAYIGNLMRSKGIQFNDRGKLDQRDIFTLFEDTVPNFAKTYYDMKSSGKYADIKLLNEKDKSDGTSESVSLKRIAAQLGYRIVEPAGVDLSDSYKRLTTDEITTLTAYNASDTLVSYLIFKTKDYQNVLNTREQMLERFKDRYVKKLTVNSTSAQFITNTIAPTQASKLQDAPIIEMFFPVSGDEFSDIIQTIEPYYEALKCNNLEWLRQAPLTCHLTDAHFDYLAQNRNINALTALDSVFNELIAKSPKYGPIKQGLPRFRVRYGTLERDLLEYMQERYAKFPTAVYELYSCYRNATSRSDGIRRYLEKYPEQPTNVEYKVKGPNGNSVKFNPDKHTYKDVVSVSTIVVIKDTRMVLSFSIGGVHGEVIDRDAYERDKRIVDTYNDRLRTLQATYPSPVDLYGAWFTDTLSDTVLPPNVQQLDTTEKQAYINQFISKKQGVTKTLLNTVFVDKDLTTYNKLSNLITYKGFKADINPKQYKVTIDLTDVIHADVDSLYPSLLILLRVFSVFNNETFEWDDVYKQLRDERVAKKAFAHRIPFEEWGPEEVLAEAIQLINKLLLNSASGVLDAGHDSNVRANNKAMNMRLCGQLILTDLVFSIEELGGESVSTNTDGVYLNGIDLDVAEPIIEAWKARYSIGATPEVMHRFISKDSNNRFEQMSETSVGNPAGGTIGNADGATSAKKMKQPSIVDETTVSYFKAHQHVDHKSDDGYDREWIASYLRDKLATIIDADTYDNSIRDTILSFMWSKQPSKGNNLVLLPTHGHISELQKVNRFMLTTNGDTLVSCSSKKIATKANKIDDAYTLYHKLSYYITSKLTKDELTDLMNDVNLSYDPTDRELSVARLLEQLPPSYVATSPLFKVFIVENLRVLDPDYRKHNVIRLTKIKAKGMSESEIDDDLYNQYLLSQDAMLRTMATLNTLSRQARLNQFGWDTGLLNREELTFMKESKVENYQPHWRVFVCNEDVSRYFKEFDWSTIDISAYVEFVMLTLDVWSKDSVTQPPALATLATNLKL